MKLRKNVDKSFDEIQYIRNIRERLMLNDFNRLDDESENFLGKNSPNNSINPYQTAKIMIEYKVDYFEFFFELEKSKCMSFEELHEIVCNYFNIPKEDINNYIIFYNDAIIAKTEILYKIYDFIKDNNLIEKFQLKDKDFLMDLKKKPDEKIKETKEKPKPKEELHTNYFSEIEYLSCEANIKDLIREFFTDSGYLYEKLHLIKNNCITSKLHELNKIFEQEEETYENLDEDERKGIMQTYINKCEEQNLKCKVNMEEAYRKSYIREDKNLIITMKNLWWFRAKQCMMVIFYIICMVFHINISKAEKNENQLNLNIYAYINNIFFNNRVFKHFLGINDINVNPKTDMLNNKKDIYFYMNFFLSNLFYKHYDKNSLRYSLKKKYNRFILDDPFIIYPKFNDSTRNLTQARSPFFFSFKYSDYFKFTKPISNLTGYKIGDCNDTGNNKKITEEYFQHYFLADDLTDKISFCKGLPIDIVHPIYEKNSALKIKIPFIDITSYKGFNNSMNVPNFIDYVKKEMQDLTSLNSRAIINETKLIHDFKNADIQLKSNISNLSDDINITVNFISQNQTEFFKGDLDNLYNFNSYLIKLNYNETVGDLYHDILNTIVKKMLERENLRVFEMNFLLYFKKFDVFVEADFFFEFGTLGITRNNMKFTIIDFVNMTKSGNLIRIFFLYTANYSIIIYLFFSLCYKSFIYFKFNKYKIRTISSTIIIYDFACLVMFIMHMIISFFLEKLFIENIYKENNLKTQILATYTLGSYYRLYKNQKVFLNMLLIMRIFYFFKISPSIEFFIKIFFQFFKAFFNIYILIIISMIISTIVFFVRLSEKSLVLRYLLDCLFFSARLILLTLESEPFYKASEGSMALCFVISFIIKVFIFSIIYAAIKELYEFEVREYQKFIKEYHVKKLGDFIFFLLKFILKNFYNFLDFLKYNKDHKEILFDMSKLLPDKRKIGSFSELNEYENKDLCDILEKNQSKLFLEKYNILRFSLQKNRIIYLIIHSKR